MAGAGMMLGVTTVGNFNERAGGLSWGVRPRGGCFAITHNAHDFTPHVRANGETDPVGVFDQILPNAVGRKGTRYRFVIIASRLLVSCDAPPGSELARGHASDGVDTGVILPPLVRPWALLGFPGDAVELNMDGRANSRSPAAQSSTLTPRGMRSSCKVAPGTQAEVDVEAQQVVQVM
jgi:hypothetical protein